MSKPITVIFTDLHLKESNFQSIEDILINQGINVCKEHNITRCFCLGDVFDSRISQKQNVLSSWGRILDAYDRAGIEMVCIRGNHDSSDYRSSDSFLKPFKYHPNFRLVDDIDIISIDKVTFGCIAYYDEDIWIERFNELMECLQDESGDAERIVCLGHIAITGSRNLGYVTENRLTLKMFQDFDMTFQGHFHDFQEVSENFVHLGSLVQNNFGEDEKKGFWLIFDDLTYSLIPSKGKSYKKLVVDLDNMTFKQADKVIKNFKKENQDAYVRVEFQGSKDQLEAVDKKVYQDLGLDVKMKMNEIEDASIDDECKEVKALDNSDIVERFKEFCTQNEFNYEEGLSILEQVL